jgi:hypothetical protein
VVGVNLPKGIHHIRIAVQAENLFLSPSDGEFAPSLNVLGVREVESTKAGLGVVPEEDIPPLAKVSLPHFVARLQIRRREELEGMRVTDCNHVCGANLWCHGNVSREVEMDRKWYELIQQHEGVWCNQRKVEHQDESLLVRFVNDEVSTRKRSEGWWMKDSK